MQRCQIFGHSKNYCPQDPICVKCSGPYMCTSVKCLYINCGVGHVSKDNSCPVRAEKATKPKPRARLPINKYATPTQRSPSGLISAESVSTNVSFAVINRRNKSRSSARATVLAGIILTFDNISNNKFNAIDTHPFGPSIP